MYEVVPVAKPGMDVELVDEEQPAAGRAVVGEKGGNTHKLISDVMPHLINIADAVYKHAREELNKK